MRLKVMIPEKVLIEQQVEKVVARAQNGYFCLLPRHVDFVAALVPGILSFEPEGGEPGYAAIDQGTLVKSGDEVLISTRHATLGDDPRELGRIVVENYMSPGQSEREARAVIENWEQDFSPMFVKAK